MSHPENTSFLGRLKARLARNKQRPDSPTAVSDLIARTAKLVSDEKNLRVQQGLLLQQQVAFRRGAPLRREVLREQAKLHRGRVRRPLKSALVRNTYTDHEGRMYMDTSNGMLLRVAKPHKSLLVRSLITNKLAQDAKDNGLALKTEVKAAPQPHGIS